MHFFVRLFALGLVLALASPAHAQLKLPNQTATYLFKIEKQGFKPSYLFGTIHLPDPRVTDLPVSVDDAFSASEAVYTEIPMEPRDMLLAAQKMMLPPGKTLADVVPPETLARMQEELAAIHPDLNLAPYMSLKIWAAGSFLLMTETQLKHPGVSAMDISFYMQGKKRGMRVGGLEKPEEQLAVFDSFSEEEQIELLDSMLAYMKQMREEKRNYTDEIIDAYLSGDLEKLEELMTTYEDQDVELQKKFEKLFIINRNHLMAERMQMRLTANPKEQAFFAVGAAHLYGKEGIPELLRKDGFTVTRVQPD